VGEVAVIYGRLLGARIRAEWQYRTSFLLFALGQALIAVLDFAVIAVLFSQVPRLAGWTLPEVAFLYGVSGVAFALADLFVSQVADALPALIREGGFDRLLVRPVGTLVQISAEFFALRRLGKLLQSGAILWLAVAWLDRDWHAGTVLLTLATIAAGAVIFGATFVLTSAIAFWAVESSEVANAFTYGGYHLTQYPLSILDGWLRRLVVYVLPLGFVAYLPALLILGKPAPAGLPRALGYASPVVAAAFVLLARAVWATALRHHRSTGS
jgi:ABC-2 type transport system permease protein